MHRTPGCDLDLDLLVAEAIANHLPDSAIKVDECTYPVPLVTLAAINRHLDLVKALCAAGAKVTASDLVLVIVYGGDITPVELLLDYGAIFDAECVRAAVQRGDWNVVLLSLDRGANVHTPYYLQPDYLQPYKALSLLHAAVWQNQTGAVLRLLKLGATVDERDSDEFTPLMKACHFREKRPYIDINSVFWLLEYGADPNAATAHGETPLLLCLGEPFDAKYNDPRFEYVRMLLKYGADPNVISPRGTTPLMLAARDNSPLVLEALLKAGADPHRMTPDGKTAFDVATARKSKKAQALLRKENA